jgi:hypothetical protein
MKCYKFVFMNKEDIKDTNNKVVEKDDITRREALKKLGYAAFAATTMFLLLNNPTKAHAQSPEDPGDDWEW